MLSAEAVVGLSAAVVVVQETYKVVHSDSEMAVVLPLAGQPQRAPRIWELPLFQLLRRHPSQHCLEL